MRRDPPKTKSAGLSERQSGSERHPIEMRTRSGPSLSSITSLASRLTIAPPSPCELPRQTNRCSAAAWRTSLRPGI